MLHNRIINLRPMQMLELDVYLSTNRLITDDAFFVPEIFAAWWSLEFEEQSAKSEWQKPIAKSHLWCQISRWLSDKRTPITEDRLSDIFLKFFKTLMRF